MNIMFRALSPRNLALCTKHLKSASLQIVSCQRNSVHTCFRQHKLHDWTYLQTNIHKCTNWSSLYVRTLSVKPEQKQPECTNKELSSKVTDVESDSKSKAYDNSNVTSSEVSQGSVGPDQQQKDPDQNIGILKRFRNAYKEHGKVLIGVHLVTSSIWFSTFYYAAYSGLDLVPLLEKVGASDKILEYSQSVGNIATAYLMYKLATPARYTVTIFGTYSTVKYLKKWGYMEAPPEGSSIRELVKDSQLQMKQKYGDMKEDVRDKYGDIKDDVKDKLDDWKEKRKPS